MSAPRRIAAVAAALVVTGLAGASPAAAAAPRVLVYSGTEGFRHASIPVAIAELRRLAERTRAFSAEFVDQPAQLTKERLGASDLVLWLSTTGAASPFSDEQERRYASFVGCGGGHMGVHASTDSYRDWPVWAELTGAFFESHPVTPTSVADDDPPEQEGWGEPEATILVTDQETPVTAPWRGRDSFRLRDEFYALDGDPSRVIADFRPALSFGGFSDPLVSLMFGSAYAPRQPLAWTGSFRGRNRLAYTNLGHSGATWRRADFQASLAEAITWIGGKRPDAACLRAEGILPPEPAAKKAKKKTKKKSSKAKKRKPGKKRKATKRRSRPAADR